MAYLVLAYPGISREDYAWIQGIRRDYDPKYFSVVQPHVTLIFGTSKLDIDAFTHHVTGKVEGVTPFAVRFDATKVIEDDSKTFWHTFLIPSTGSAEINALHDAFYTDDLASELRPDIPFIPHLGIGTGTEDAMRDLAAKIDADNHVVEGTIDTLTIVEYDGSVVHDITTISL